MRHLYVPLSDYFVQWITDALWGLLGFRACYTHQYGVLSGCVQEELI